jgi:hypothetical protein
MNTNLAGTVTMIGIAKVDLDTVGRLLIKISLLNLLRGLVLNLNFI